MSAKNYSSPQYFQKKVWEQSNQIKPSKSRIVLFLSLWGISDQHNTTLYSGRYQDNIARQKKGNFQFICAHCALNFRLLEQAHGIPIVDVDIGP